MPAATEKPAKKPQNEPEDPLKQVLTAVDRKVSNLEKKKTKLEALKQKLAHGDRLEAPQREAVARYDQIVHNLEFAQELQKQFEAISNEAERLQKKRLKKERIEKRVMEMRRVQELIELQSLLDSLGSETVRSDLQTGAHGAVVVTEENLTQLDEFYQLICPSREGCENYREQTMSASVHLVNLLDSSHKEIVGSTYKQIKELLTLLNSCGYFEKSTEKTDTQDTDKEETKEEVESSTTSVEKEHVEEIATTTDNIEYSDPVEPAFSDPVIEPQPTVPPTLPVANQEMDNQYFTPIEERKNRPVQEIVTQGSFNFLQDSMLDFDSAHADPAIVAVLPNQPMTRPLSSQQPDSQPTAYTNPPYSDQSHFDDGYNMTTTDQNWANSTAFPTEDNIYQDNLMGNQPSTYPETLDQQAELDESKKFTMNAKAPAFTSMYNQGGDNSDSQNNSSHTYQGNNQNDGGYRSNNRGGYRGDNYRSDNNYRGRNNRGDSNQNGYSRGRGGRGGYQGYQGRNDYNRNDGYQGYGGGGGNYKSGGYQGRGGQRGGRGGPPRGGNSRGGNRGGFGRPQN